MLAIKYLAGSVGRALDANLAGRLNNCGNHAISGFIRNLVLNTLIFIDASAIGRWVVSVVICRCGTR